MTTKNTLWSLGSCPNSSLNSVEPSVPPQSASDPSLIINHGRSTPVAPPPFSPDRLEHSSDAAGPSSGSGCSPIFQQNGSRSPSEIEVYSVKNADIPAHFGPSSHVSGKANKVSKELIFSNNHPKSASALLEKYEQKVREPDISPEPIANEPLTIAHAAAHSRTFPLLDAVLDSTVPSKALSSNGSHTPAESAARAANVRITPPAETPSSSSQTLAPSSFLPMVSRDRKFRAHSFAAKLTLDQRRTLVRWLGDPDLLLVDIQRKIAAPPPEGFGIHVHHVTVRRLRAMYENTDLEHWLSEAMDAACDILEPTNGAEIAPLRESLIYILYSQVIQKSRKLFAPREFNQCVAAIERLEKMKARAEQQQTRPSRQPAPQGHLRVDLKIHHPKTKKRRPVKIVASQGTCE